MDHADGNWTFWKLFICQTKAMKFVGNCLVYKTHINITDSFIHLAGIPVTNGRTVSMSGIKRRAYWPTVMDSDTTESTYSPNVFSLHSPHWWSLLDESRWDGSQKLRSSICWPALVPQKDASLRQGERSFSTSCNVCAKRTWVSCKLMHYADGKHGV